MPNLPCRSLVFAALLLLNTVVVVAQPADTVLVDGRIHVVDDKNQIVEALAIRDGRILAIGKSETIRKQHVGSTTKVVKLGGKTVIPGIIAAHCHALGVARAELEQPHAELLSIAEVQDWIRHRAKQVDKTTWIKVPRSDITRLRERRHPTPAELDEACTTHPVIFTAARKTVLNSRGFRLAGVTDRNAEIPDGRIILDKQNKPLLIAGGNAHLRKLMPRAEHTQKELLESLQNVHRHYNAVGITSIFERAANIDTFLLYRKLRDEDRLLVRMVQTFRQGFRSAKDVENYVNKLKMKTGDGDAWVRVGPLKIMVDGGIHWGNTFLREPYGAKRAAFYVHDSPDYRGDIRYTADQMAEIFQAGHRLGWQWCCHVTGDAGVDRVLKAIETVAEEDPSIKKRRFSLTHAYFPIEDAVRRAKSLGVCVDTQSSLYFKDSDAIAEFYGESWADRFIGVGEWRRGGIPTAIAGDHMMGLDPDRSMNAYNPFLMLYVAVTRKNRAGKVYGAHQRLSRHEALRCITKWPAYLSFEEDLKGSLETGKLADLVVLDRDYFTCPEDEIKDIQVLKTMLDGKIVYVRPQPR
ncbi:MAG: amidohydrolase [Planctomycetes bacterium]|nr:amidohydrolase [Planctomycetota bacterium]